MNEISINNHALAIREYNGQRVVTLKDIDAVHERPDGTARKRFNDNREHFIEGVDYFKISPSEFRTAMGEMDIRQQNNITLITETGYLMLVKSFTDNLAWRVQRELVNSYFRVKEIQKPFDVKETNAKIRMSNQLLKLSKSPTLSNECKRALVIQAAEILVGKLPENALKAATPSNPISDFCTFCKNSNVEIVNRPTNVVYGRYCEYCIENNLEPISNIEFSKQVKKSMNVKIIDKKINNKKYRIFVENN